ncbi:MAG: hypothetical protein ACRD5B_00075 [Nitrososphaeraceae archaeon]
MAITIKNTNLSIQTATSTFPVLGNIAVGVAFCIARVSKGVT